MAAVGLLFAFAASKPVARISPRFIPHEQRSPHSALPDELFESINAQKRARMNWKGVPML